MKRFFLAISLLLVVALGGCSVHSDVLTTAISQIEDSNHIEQLHDYDSPYTICYKNNDDTYSMYIFASPIQYKTNSGYEIIDNTVIESSDPNYAFENKANSIKTYFPKTLDNYFKVVSESEYMEFKPNFDVSSFSSAKKITFTNMYGDKVSAVIYKSSNMNLVFYPTKAGIKLEVVLEEEPTDNCFQFDVITSGTFFEDKQNGYILFKNSTENVGLVYTPLVKSVSMDKTSKKTSINSTTSIFKEGGDYLVNFSIDESLLSDDQSIYPVCLDPSFELYLNKMPDSSVYSKFNTNSYLRHFAVIGEDSILGEGWEYLRLRLNYVVGINTEKIQSVSYHLKSLTENPDCSAIGAYIIQNQWSSTGITWSTKETADESVNSYVSYDANGYINLDITKFAKDCFSDSTWDSESKGLLLRANSENAIILGTSDNSLYTPYINITLSKLPSYFEPKENINPT